MVDADKTTKHLLMHVNRYEGTQVDDLIKLCYQNSFGPAHLHQNPDIKTIAAYIKQELDAGVPAMASPFEAIGNGYYRVHLCAVPQGLLSLDALIIAFFTSMTERSGFNDKTLEHFKKQLTLLIQLAEEDRLPLKLHTVLDGINDYLASGIRPIRHSDIFRKNHHPAYRVIHRDYIVKEVNNG